MAGPTQIRSGIQDALCPLNRNVVRAKPASPSGAGLAASVLSTTVTPDRSEVIALMQPSLSLGVAARSPGTAAFAEVASATLPDRGRNSQADGDELRLEVVRVLRDPLRRVGRDVEDVLQADPAVTRAIEAWLERDHVAGDEVVSDDRQPRAFVHFEADAVAEPVEEAAVEHLARLLRQLRGVAGRGEDIAGDLHEVASVHAGFRRLGRPVERLLAQPVVLADLVGNISDDVGPRHVGVDGRLGVARPQVEDDWLAGRDHAGSHVVPDGALGAVRDDELVGDRAALDEDLLHLRLDRFARERLALVPEHTVGAGLGIAQHRACNVERGVACALRAAEPSDLARVLVPSAILEELAVDPNLDTVGAEMIGELEREPRGDHGARHADLLQRARVDLEHRLHRWRAAAQELVDPELLGGKRLDIGRDRLQTLALEGGDDDEAAAVVLDVQEVVRD